jgi:hypothetical protein
VGRLVIKQGSFDVLEAAARDSLVPLLENSTGFIGCHLADLCEQGSIRPHIDRVFPLEAAADAHRFLHERRNVGKVLLRPRGLSQCLPAQHPAPRWSPRHRCDVEHSEVRQRPVGSQTGDLYRPEAEVAIPLIRAVQVAMHQIARPDGIGDALQPGAVRFVAAKVGRVPFRRRPREIVSYGRRAVMAHHDVRNAGPDQRGFLSIGDLFLRPPVPALMPACSVQADSAAAGEPAPATPFPAMAARQMVDPRHHGNTAVGEHPAAQRSELSEVLVIAVNEPELGALLGESGAHRT